MFNNPIISTDVLGDCPDGNCKDLPKDVDGKNDYEQQDYWLETSSSGGQGTRKEITQVKETVKNVVGNWSEDGKKWVENVQITTRVAELNAEGELINEVETIEKFTRSYTRGRLRQATLFGEEESPYLILQETSDKQITVNDGGSNRSNNFQELLSLQIRYIDKINERVDLDVFSNAFFSRNIGNDYYNQKQADASYASGQSLVLPHTSGLSNVANLGRSYSSIALSGGISFWSYPNFEISSIIFDYKRIKRGSLTKPKISIYNNRFKDIQEATRTKF